MIRFQASTPSPVTPLPSCRRSLIDRMADDMREMAFAGETVSSETLQSRGWTLKTVQRFSPEAVALARRHSVRQLT